MDHHQNDMGLWRSIRPKLLILVALAIAVITISFAGTNSHMYGRAAIVSPEVQFTDASAGGMQIVPASCPSDPGNPDYPHDTCGGPLCSNGLDYSKFGPNCVCLSAYAHQVGSGCACNVGYTTGVGNDTGFCAPSAIPVTTSVTISPSPANADGSAEHTITITSTDADGGSTIQDQLTLINYVGVNAGAYRGYLVWASDNFAWGFGGAPNMKDIKSCAGGGQAGIYVPAYGPEYTDILSCTTSVSGQTRISTYVVVFNTIFTTPATNNNLSGYTLDSSQTGDGWHAFDYFDLASCTGSAPSNASICSGDNSGLSVNTPNTLTASCGAAKCEYTCSAGYGLSGGVCVPFSCTGTPSNATLCSGANSNLTGDTPSTVVSSCGTAKCEYRCASGFQKSGNTCVACTPNGTTSCLDITHIQNNCNTVTQTCSGGKICSATGSTASCNCPAGQFFNGTSCIASCTDSYFCSGNDLMHQNTSCVNSLSQTCSYGCSAGGCLAQVVAKINFTVTPLLVRKNDTVSVVWSTTNAASCAVTSTNGDSWNGLSGTQTSKPIPNSVVFTIRCVSTTGPIVTQSATVNLIPTFCEPGVQGC